MSLTVKQLIILSLVAGFTACNLWPLLGVYDIYFFFQGVSKLLVATIVVHLTKCEDKTNRVAWVALLWAVLDVAKETNKLTGLHLFFDPTRYKTTEYTLYGIVTVAALIGKKGLVELLLLYNLNFNSPCRKKTNSICTQYQISYE